MTRFHIRRYNPLAFAAIFFVALALLLMAGDTIAHATASADIKGQLKVPNQTHYGGTNLDYIAYARAINLSSVPSDDIQIYVILPDDGSESFVESTIPAGCSHPNGFGLLYLACYFEINLQQNQYKQVVFYLHQNFPSTEKAVTEDYDNAQATDPDFSNNGGFEAATY